MFGKKQEAQTSGTRKCAHPACFCTVEPGKKFCCDRCHDARGMTELNCQCHHPACESSGA